MRNAQSVFQSLTMSCGMKHATEISTSYPSKINIDSATVEAWQIIFVFIQFSL